MGLCIKNKIYCKKIAGLMNFPLDFFGKNRIILISASCTILIWRTTIMKRTWTKLVAMCLTLLMTLPLLAACGGSADDAIIIGGIGPLTGGVASYGTSAKQGMEIAIEEINAAGGVNGVKLQLEFMDDEADGAKAKTAFENLMDKGMDVLIGCVTSGASVAINDLVLEEGILQITPSASQKEAAQNPNSFRLCFTDPLQGTTMAEYAYSLGYRKAAVVYNQDDSYSTGILSAFREAFTNLGGTISVEVPFSKETDDFSAHVTKVQGVDADFVLLPFYNDVAAKFLTAVNAKGLSLPMIGSDGMDGILNYLKGEDAKLAEGLVYLTPFIASDPDEKIQKFVATYKEKYGAEPDQFAADGYDCVYVGARLLSEKAGITSNEIDNAALTQP